MAKRCASSRICWMRCGARLVLHPPGAACQRLRHGRVVVTRLDAIDIESAVIGLQWSLGGEDHARSNGCLALGVTDVETLNALGHGVVKVNRLRYRLAKIILTVKGQQDFANI